MAQQGAGTLYKAQPGGGTLQTKTDQPRKPERERAAGNNQYRPQAGREKKMKYMTKKTAREELERIKDLDLTGYFDGSVTAARMKDMLRNEMHFGEAEANTIIAALVLAGAKFPV